jgi:hypothetical protein
MAILTIAALIVSGLTAIFVIYINVKHPLPVESDIKNIA